MKHEPVGVRLGARSLLLSSAAGEREDEERAPHGVKSDELIATSTANRVPWQPGKRWSRAHGFSRWFAAGMTMMSLFERTWTLFGKKAQGWDSALLTPTSDDGTWVDSVDGNRSITQRTYDLVTGNVMSRRKPIQTDTNGPSMTYDYDSPLCQRS